MAQPKSGTSPGTAPVEIAEPTPRDWRTGHPDSPEIRTAVVASIAATWREAWAR